MISIHSLSTHPVVSLPMFLFIFISEVHDSSYLCIHLSRYSPGLRGPKWSPPWRNILWWLILEECKSVPDFRVYFKAKVFLTVTTCQRAWRVLQPLNHEEKRTRTSKRTTEAASDSSPPLHKQRCSRPRGENRTPLLLHRMETLNSFATEPAGFFKGKKSTYQEIPKSHSGATIQRKPSFSNTPVSPAELPRESSTGNHQDVHSQMNGYARRATYRQRMMTQSEAPRKSCQFFRIDSPSEDHTPSRKSDTERWIVYILQQSGGIQKHHKWTSFPDRNRFPATDIKPRLGKGMSGMKGG